MRVDGLQTAADMLRHAGLEWGVGLQPVCRQERRPVEGAAIAKFERDLIRDRVISGLRRAKAQGRRLGRPRLHHVDVTEVRRLVAEGLSLRAAGRALGVHPMVVRHALAG